MKLFSVGQSKVKTWRGCQQAYHFKYVEELQRKRTKRPFAFGTIIHRMIEANAQGDDPFGVLDEINLENLQIFASEREMYGDIIEDIRIIMEDYFIFHRDGLRFIPVRDENKEMRFAEHEFAIPLEELTREPKAKGIVFKGQVDGLGKTPNDLRWLIEHKSRDKLPNHDERWRNLQSTVYARAVKRLGWLKKVDGVCWNYIYSKAPTIPKPIKDGSRLSRQAIVTLPSVLRRALEQHNLKAEDHPELVSSAEASRKEYFQRFYVPVNQTVQDIIFNGFVETAIEMREGSGTKKCKNIGRHCSWCDYEPLCRTELTGGDVDFVRQGEFQNEDPEGYRRTSRAARAGGNSKDKETSDEKTRGQRTSKLRVLR